MDSKFIYYKFKAEIERNKHKNMRVDRYSRELTYLRRVIMYKAIKRYRLRIAALFVLIAAFLGSVFLIDILSGNEKSAFAIDNRSNEFGLEIKTKEAFTGDSNLAPGKPVPGIYSLINKGNWTLKPDLSVQLNSENSKILFEALMFKVLDSEAKVVYEGELQSCNKVVLAEIPSGASNDYTFIVELPASKGNEYQSQSADVKFIVNASRIYNEDNSDEPSNPIDDLIKDEYNRIGGDDRIDTAIKIAQAGWVNANAVIIARDDDFPDALVGAPLAYKLDAPILLTNKEVLSPVTKQEINRLQAKQAYVLGGYGAVSSTVENEITTMGLNVIRLGGGDRYGTASLVAYQVGSDGRAILAYGENFPDALAVSPWAAVNNIPILLTTTDSLPKDTEEAIRSLNVKKTIIVGGEGVISSSVSSILPGNSRIAGKNRYETATLILQELGINCTRYFMATGEDFPDALTGSVLAAKSKSLILMVDAQLSEPSVISFLKDKSKEKKIPVVLGGVGAIPQSVIVKTQSVFEGKP